MRIRKPLRAASLLLLLAAMLCAWGCGGGSHRGSHGSAGATPEPAPPTPDTTPVEALRTPAGLVLKIDQPTPVPSLTPTAGH